MSTPPHQVLTGGSAGKTVSTPNKWPSNKFYKESVTLVIGSNRENYILHMDLLCFYSDFFRAAFNGSFKEANERKIELLDVEVKVFEAFQAWLYTRSLLNNEEPDQDGKRTKYPDHVTLAKLWIFGDRYQIPLLQNNTIDAIFAKVNLDKVLPVNSAKTIYENTVTSSPLRKAIIEILAHRSYINDGMNSIISPFYVETCWTKESLADLLRAVKLAWDQKLPINTLPKREKCHFHVHAEGEHC